MKKFEKMTRRAFLAATTTTAVAASFPIRVNAAEVVPGKKSPNEKILCAGIGVGGKGLGDIMECKREQVVALCDVDDKRAKEAYYRLKDAKQFKDYRKMLEEMPEIEAVHVSTPDHMHAPAAYMAMKMGKHVCVQKPLTHTIAEARLLRQTAAEMGVITNMGNQGHAGDGVRELCEMIWAGAIGDVKEAHIWTNRPIWPQGLAEPLAEEPVPDWMDWDLWIGAAPMRPYNKEYAPFNWRGWWDFGCGAIGDMACHIMDPAFWSLKLYEAETFTCEAIAVNQITDQTAPLSSVIKFNVPARGTMGAVEIYWYDGGMMPSRPEELKGEILGDDDQTNGSLFIGTDGYATAGTYGGNSRLLPAARMADFTRPAESIPRVRGGNPQREWLEAIKGGPTPGSHFDYSGPLTEMANFGNVALISGKKLEYSLKEGKVLNDESANKYLTKEYRAGWELPC